MAVLTKDYFSASYLKPRIDYFFVRTSNSKPNGVPVDYEWEVVYPGWRLLNLYRDKKIKWSKYTEQYRTHLKEHPAEILATWNEIQSLAGNKCIVLLCWCKDEKFCHRTLLLEHLQERGLA